MTLTIRERVALWYAVLLVTVLLLVSGAISMVYARIGIARIDTVLASAIQTVDRVTIHELAEELTLPEASQGALTELTLPNVGVAILDSTGTVLVSQAAGAPELTPAQLAPERGNDQARTLPGSNIRLAASRRQHGAFSYSIVVWTSLGPFQRERATLQNTILVSMPIAALVAMVGGWLISRHALRPLTRMAVEAAVIDRHRLDARLSVTSSRGELGQFANAFNAVLERLSSVVQAQRQFMADSSHELRTPVSIARTAAQVTLGAATRSEGEYRESLTIIADQMQRVTRMVDDMFLLALADLNARPLDCRDFYLNEVLADCVRAANVLAATRLVTVSARIGPDDLPARGDEGLVRQMVMNLLENAIRHTPTNGAVTLTVAVEPDATTVAIEDSGPGIPPDFQKRVFERFVRLDAGGRGGGLGLAIARWIAEQHGWSLHVDGEGRHSSRFLLTLPVKSRPVELIPARQAVTPWPTAESSLTQCTTRE